MTWGNRSEALMLNWLYEGGKRGEIGLKLNFVYYLIEELLHISSYLF